MVAAKRAKARDVKHAFTMSHCYSLVYMMDSNKSLFFMESDDTFLETFEVCVITCRVKRINIVSIRTK